MAQITTGLVGNPTAHYSFSYDSSLRRTAANPTGPEPARTNALIQACETDFNWMSGFFGNPGLDYSIPCTVQVTQNSGGASWGLGGGKLTVTLNPGNGGVTMCRYLLVSEITEQFMREQGRGWYGTNTEGSEGEGLSRFLAARLLAINGLGYPPAGFDNSNLWMNSPRNDYRQQHQQDRRWPRRDHGLRASVHLLSLKPTRLHHQSNRRRWGAHPRRRLQQPHWRRGRSLPVFQGAGRQRVSGHVHDPGP